LLIRITGANLRSTSFTTRSSSGSCTGLGSTKRSCLVKLVRRLVLPAKAVEDAFHVAIATLHGMDYLLTWNCRHIANAEIIRRLVELCEELGYELPTLCTPEQLMGS